MLSLTLIRPGTTLCARAGLLSCSLAPKILGQGLWVHLTGHVAAAKPLSAFDWRGFHNMSPATRGLHANTEPGIQEAAPFSMTVTAPALDMVSSPGAAVAQLLSVFQTGWIQALTGSVCGERLSPDAVLTPLPFCMLFTFRCWHLLKERKEEKQGCLPFPDRNQKLTILGLKTPQSDLLGPVGLPRTDWSLTMA